MLFKHNTRIWNWKQMLLFLETEHVFAHFLQGNWQNTNNQNKKTQAPYSYSHPGFAFWMVFVLVQTAYTGLLMTPCATWLHKKQGKKLSWSSLSSKCVVSHHKREIRYKQRLCKKQKERLMARGVSRTGNETRQVSAELDMGRQL